VRADDQHIVVISRSFVAAITFSDDQKSVFIFFHVAVGKSARATEFGAANLEPDQIVRVIDHAHLVGFSVAYPQHGLLPLVNVFQFLRTQVATPVECNLPGCGRKPTVCI
jgi:hypothetical protein